MAWVENLRGHYTAYILSLPQVLLEFFFTEFLYGSARTASVDLWASFWPDEPAWRRYGLLPC